MSLFEQQNKEFSRRHIGTIEHDTEAMLKTIGVESLDELIKKTIPASIRLHEPLKLPEAVSEFTYLQELKLVAQLRAAGPNS